MCGPPLNHSSHKTDTVFQQTNLKCTMYVDTEIIPELLQVLTVTWLQYLAKYLLNNWGLLLPCGAKFTLWCLWEEFPVGRELRRTWECCQWAAETTACLHFLPNPIETYVYTQITPWPLNQFFCACILSILETHAHKGRHFHHFTINIVTYRSTRVATHKPKKRKGKKKKAGFHSAPPQNVSSSQKPQWWKLSRGFWERGKCCNSASGPISGRALWWMGDSKNFKMYSRKGIFRMHPHGWNDWLLVWF